MNEVTKEARVHAVFESIARDYDRMNTVISLGRHRAWRRYAMRRMNVQPGWQALDVCCGTCDWAISLAEAVGPHGRVVGLDFSANMLAVGAKKVRARGLDDRTELVLGNAMNLPFADNTFDCATIGFALRNVPDIRRVLSEMRRVVKPGGMVVSIDVSKPLWKPYRALFYLYVYHILPLLGKVFAGKYDEYRWLPESLTDFPDSVALARVFEEVGLTDVFVKRFCGGAAALHIGYKPGPASERERAR